MWWNLDISPHTWISDKQCHTHAINNNKIQNFNTLLKNHGTIFRDRKGPLLMKCLPRGHTTNAAPYCETLKKLCQDIKTNDKECWSRECAYCMTMPVHILLMAHKNCCREVLARTLHSPDLTPSDFYLFPKFKEHLGQQGVWKDFCGQWWGSRGSDNLVESTSGRLLRCWNKKAHSQAHYLY